MRTAAPFAICFLFAFVGASLFAADPTAEKVTYDDQVRPIFRQHCLMCHSADSKKGDLALDTYASALAGGASGEVVYASDLDASRLWDLVSHADEPLMPPNSDKLPDDKLEWIRRWIEGGALENRGSVATKRKASGLAMTAPAARGKPDGPAAMPESLYREPVVYTRRAAAVTGLSASPWAPLIAVAGQRQVALYHAESAGLVGIVPFLEGTPNALRFTRDGNLLLVAGGRGGALGVAALYDVRTGSRLITVGDELDTVLAADSNAAQTLIALGGPKRVVRVYSTADRSLAFEIRKHTEWITAIAFSPDGELLLTADRNGGAFLWEAETGREVATLRGHSGSVNSADWRADSQIVATAGADGSVRLWEREEGKQIKSFTAHGGGTEDVRFAPDGRLVTAGRDRHVRLWKPDGAAIKEIARFGDIALAACISFDGQRVAAGDFSGDVRLLDVEGNEIAKLPPNPPTLAMRVASAERHAQQAATAREAVVSAKADADTALTTAKAEADRRAGVLAVAEAKLTEAQANQQAAATELAQSDQGITSAKQGIGQATARLERAASAVTAADEALFKAREANGDVATAEANVTEATERVKQAVAGVEAGHAALKLADSTRDAAAKRLAEMQGAIAAAEKAVQTGKAAEDEFTPILAAAQQLVAAKAQEFASQQQLVDAAKTAVEEAKAELAAFAQAPQRLAAAIEAARAKSTTVSAALATATQAQRQAARGLEARQAAADEAEKKLAAAKAEFEKHKKAMDEANAALRTRQNALEAAAQAHAQAEAEAAQAEADRQMFEKTLEIRAAYQN